MYWAYSLLVENISFMCPRICIDHILQLKMFSVLVFSIFSILRYFHYISWAYFAHDRPLAGGSEANICQACQSITLLLAPLTFFPMFQIFCKIYPFLEYLLGLLVHQSLDILSFVPNICKIYPFLEYLLGLLVQIFFFCKFSPFLNTC